MLINEAQTNNRLNEFDEDVLRRLVGGADVQVKRNYNEDDDNEDSQPSVSVQKSDVTTTVYKNSIPVIAQ